MIGRTFGRYRIVEPLGEGGMGTVWKAEDDLLGRSVALKLLSARMADSDSACARLLREARAAGALDHPGIGTVYDAGEQDGELFIAMRLVDGGTVADRTRSQGTLGLLAAVRIAADAADALGHAHARGILHRDVSPRNLMLTKEGQVVVVDFGLALAEGTSRLTQSGTTVGTAYYVAPEIILGEQPDRRSDIYALGAVLYEMLTGAPPFEGEHLQTVVYAAVNAPAAPPSAKRPDIPTELDRIVLKALAKKPEDRYATMEELRDDLDVWNASGAIQDDAVRPTVESWRPKTTPTTRTLNSVVRPQLAAHARRIAVVVAVVALVALAAGGALWFTRRIEPSSSRIYASVAVLPFKNTSADPTETNYLSEGLTQTTISKLTQMTGLRVPPWMTVSRFLNSTVPRETLASDLKVDAILVGTYRTEGSRIRGTVSIVDGRNGHQVWAEDFDESQSDLFAMQNRIAIKAATKLLGRLSDEQAAGLGVPVAASIEAYGYYLKGSVALHKQTEAAEEEALDLFRRAIEIDPRYAPAWVGVGAVHADRYYMGWYGGWKDLATAEEAYLKALEFDPTSIAARRGLIHVFWQRGQSEECLKQGKLVAASGVRGTETILAQAEAYLFGGLEDRALPLLRQLMKDEPANPAAPWFMVVAGCWAGSFQEAVDAGERFLHEFGEDSEVHVWLGVAFHSLGQRRKAESHYRRSIEIASPGAVNGGRLFSAALFRQEGRLDEADRMALELIDALETKVTRAPENYKLRGLLVGGYALVGDLTRMRAEEVLIRQSLGAGALGDLMLNAGIVGQKEYFVRLDRDQLRAGCFGRVGANLRALYADPNLEDYPGYNELAAEEAVEFKRLEALY